MDDAEDTSYPDPGQLAKLIAPVSDERELEDDVEEMKRFLDERIRPLLAEAVKGAIRARSDNMLVFIADYLRDANVNLRNLKETDKMLHMLALEKKGLIKERVADAVIKNPKSKLLKDAQKVMDGDNPPELSPLMRLSRSMEQVTSGISSSLYATKSTLKIISKKQKAAARGGNEVDKEDRLSLKTERVAAKDVLALNECVQLSAQGILAALERADMALTESIVGVRQINGYIPQLESDTINAAFQKVTKQSEHAFDDLSDAVKMHQENHMKKDDYKLMDFYEQSRTAMQSKLSVIEQSMQKSIDNFRKDIEVYLEKHREALVANFNTAAMRNNGTRKVKEVMTKIADHIKFLYTHREAILTAEEKPGVKKGHRTKVKCSLLRPPVYGSLALVHVFVESFLMGNLKRYQYPEGDLGQLGVDNEVIVTELHQNLMTICETLERRLGDDTLMEGVKLETRLFELTMDFTAVMRDWEKTLVDAFEHEKKLVVEHVGKQKGGSKQIKDSHVDVQPIIDLYTVRLENVLLNIHSLVKTTMSSASVANESKKNAMLACMEHVQHALTTAQANIAQIVESCVFHLGKGALINRAIRILEGAPAISEKVIDYHLKLMGRSMPEGHESYVTEAKLIKAQKALADSRYEESPQVLKATYRSKK